MVKEENLFFGNTNESNHFFNRFSFYVKGTMNNTLSESQVRSGNGAISDKLEDEFL